MLALATALPVALMAAAKGVAEVLGVGERTVEELVNAAKDGDRDSYSELYRRYRSATHSVALSVVSRDAAGDVVQEAFARALHKLPSLRDPTRFGGWLMTITRNAALDVARHGQRHRTDDDALEHLSVKDPPRLEVARVLTVLRSLPENYSEPLIMRLVEGMSGKEIAERTGLTPGSVRVNLHRGMAMLRAKLGNK